MSAARALLLSFALAVAPAGVHAAGSVSPAAKTRVTFQPTPLEVRAGATLEAVFPFTVAAGFHVQANPASDEFLIPAALTLDAGCGVKIGAAKYPAPTPYRLEGTDKDLATFAGTFEVRVPLTAIRSAPPGRCVLKGRLHYQACDEKTCLFPSTLELEIPVTIAPRG